MQINRLFEIVYLLLNKKNTTAKSLAEHFEVSPRTIYRDVELLSSAGIPIYMTKGKGGGIGLLPDFVLNKTVLTEREKTDILSALHAVDAVSLEKADTAVKKLSSLFGDTNTDWVAVDFSQWADGEEAEVFRTLKESIIRKQCVSFLYYSSAGNVKRKVEPMKLCFKGQSWYLYAYCTLREDFRFFKLRRLKSLTLLESHFTRNCPSKIFMEEDKFLDSHVLITLKISKEMAYRVYDEFLQYEVLKDGSFLVKFDMALNAWLYQYIATFGEYCEILEPEDLRREMGKKLERTLKQYL